MASIADVLPRPFADLTVDDVGALASRANPEDRETLFLELKARADKRSIAKSAAAFANTVGGLLVVGATDDGDMTGTPRPVPGDLQVWVKDVLRERVMPLPPFRVRWLDMSADVGCLLVLIEESTSTPHILLDKGSIYIRSPGSSDPVPIRDQATLWELIRRGREARLRADRGVGEAMQGVPTAASNGWEVAAFMATGMPADFAERAFHTDGTLIRAALRLFSTETYVDHIFSLQPFDTTVGWTLSAGTAERMHVQNNAVAIHEEVAVFSDGVVRTRWWDERDSATRVGYENRVELTTIVARLMDGVAAARQLLDAAGCHGELAVTLRCGHPPRIVYAAPDGDSRDRDLQFEHPTLWLPLTEDANRDEAFRIQVMNALRRSAGWAPVSAPII